ncbi:carph-isopro domain-containing protein [Sphingomonas sp. VDB2]|uniref:carph-isopro domain-containing protein n=1 Tax=Sphingomonas sp. VDB2 TaxID=3228751 RepID=UPI003A80B42C
MEQNISVFELFGGIRPMARHIGEPPSNVAAWKRVGRIPAEKQPHVLEVGLALNLPITAEHVVFPLGRPDAVDDLSLSLCSPPVACHRSGKAQRKDAA